MCTGCTGGFPFLLRCVAGGMSFVSSGITWGLVVVNSYPPGLDLLICNLVSTLGGGAGASYCGGSVMVGGVS